MSKSPPVGKIYHRGTGKIYHRDTEMAVISILAPANVMPPAGL
jgi:hypothetical protein